VDDWLKSLDGEVGIDLVAADFFGMKLGPTPIVLRARDGRLRIDTIDTTLNQGRIHLEPEVVIDDKAGAMLRLGPESSVVDAAINDEVSHRVLAFAAPVLDNATRAHGRVSARLKEATIPIGGDSPKNLTVTGSVLFQDAEFVPGPMADQLFDLIGLVDRPSMKLNKPVSLTIADRRVYQRGLVLPVGSFTEITMEGWVDFDRNLALKASLPLTPTMLRDKPLMGDFLTGLRVSVPIGGTLDKPEVDRDAFNLAMQELGKTLLERTLTRGVPNLIDLFTRPRDPNAPPPLTPQERRARRQERRMQP
jgi:translocation and assembly module TamB